MPLDLLGVRLFRGGGGGKRRVFSDFEYGRNGERVRVPGDALNRRLCLGSFYLEIGMRKSPSPPDWWNNGH